jgi:hypothetical protein
LQVRIGLGDESAGFLERQGVRGVLVAIGNGGQLGKSARGGGSGVANAGWKLQG